MPTVTTREHLWQASPLCPTADEYSPILGPDPHEANAAADRLTSMVLCRRRKRKTAASFDKCFADFTAARQSDAGDTARARGFPVDRPQLISAVRCGGR